MQTDGSGDEQLEEPTDPARESSTAPADIEAVLGQLDELESTATTAAQRQQIDATRSLIERLPGKRFVDHQIDKYTSRDVGEAVVGSIVFALPLLVEDGVFEIADHFVEFLVAGVPVFLLANVVFVCGLTAGVIYGVDVREVRITNPIFGVIPRRLVGVLGVSLLMTTMLMTMWGRLFVDDPSTMAMVARITVIWAAAALGASLGDILPGESKGTDLSLSALSDRSAEQSTHSIGDEPQ